MHTHKHPPINIHLQTYTPTNTHPQAFTHKHPPTSIHLQTHTHTHTHARARTHARTHTHTHTSTLKRIYTYAYQQTPLTNTHQQPQTPSTGLRHPSIGGSARKRRSECATTLQPLPPPPQPIYTPTPRQNIPRNHTTTNTGIMYRRFNP